jgi:hypothetical protein
VFKGMSDTQKRLFADGYVSSLKERIAAIPDKNNIWNRIDNSGAARDKIEMVLGKNVANEIELMQRVERIFERSKSEVGSNSTTAMQLITHSLIGGVGSTIGFGDPTIGGIAGLALAGSRHRANQQVSERIGQLLMSRDPEIVERAMKAIARNEKYMNVARQVLASSAGRIGGSNIQNEVPRQ